MCSLLLQLTQSIFVVVAWTFRKACKRTNGQQGTEGIGSPITYPEMQTQTQLVF
jgi:hypothetical protein